MKRQHDSSPSPFSYGKHNCSPTLHRMNSWHITGITTPRPVNRPKHFHLLPVLRANNSTPQGTLGASHVGYLISDGRGPFDHPSSPLPIMSSSPSLPAFPSKPDVSMRAPAPKGSSSPLPTFSSSPAHHSSPIHYVPTSASTSPINSSFIAPAKSALPPSRVATSCRSQNPPRKYRAPPPKSDPAMMALREYYDLLVGCCVYCFASGIANANSHLLKSCPYGIGYGEEQEWKDYHCQWNIEKGCCYGCGTEIMVRNVHVVFLSH